MSSSSAAISGHRSGGEVDEHRGAGDAAEAEEDLVVAAPERLAQPVGEHPVRQAALKRTGWNVSRTAELLDVDRATVYNKIKRYGLGRPAGVAAGEAR